MLFKKSNKNRLSIKRRTPKPRKSSRFLELAIVAILALVIIYTISFAIRITHGFSKTIDIPEYTVRLQVLNGCGVDGAAARVAKSLPGIVKLPLEVTVVEVADFDSYYVEKTFMISREKDLKPVEILSTQLSLEKGDLVYEPIENNYRSISATLVLGEDFEKTILEPLKEENR